MTHHQDEVSLCQVLKSNGVQNNTLQRLFQHARLLDGFALVVVQEARFDRHFVRDLTWSRHQLEELAERRFVAAQRAAARSGSASSPHDAPWSGDADMQGPTCFSDLFKKVCLLT